MALEQFRRSILDHELSKAEQLWASGELPESVPDHVIEEALDGQRASLLHVVASLGYTDCIKALLGNTKDSLNVNGQDPLGWTPLMYAIANGHVEAVNVFLDCKTCDVTNQDGYLQTPLHLEAQYHSKTVSVINSLLRCQAAINAEDVMGLTPFLRAVEVNNCLVAEFLYSKGCDILMAGYDGRSALHIAALHHREALLIWLLKIGLSKLVNGLDHNFQTALMLCVQHKSSSESMYNIMKLLITAGARVNHQDCHGNTAILLAMLNPSAIKFTHIELLLEAGSDPNIPNREGLTPIWQAVYDGVHYPDRQQIIQLLVRTNCYLNMSCRGKLLFTSGLNSVYCYETFMSPLEVALNSGYYDAAKMLVMAGCKIRQDLRYDKQVTDVPEELAWLQNVLENPTSLQHQCRLVIRKILGDEIQPKVHRLPLPYKVKSYILLHGVC